MPSLLRRERRPPTRAEAGMSHVMIRDARIDTSKNVGASVGKKELHRHEVGGVVNALASNEWTARLRPRAFDIARSPCGGLPDYFGPPFSFGLLLPGACAGLPEGNCPG